MSLGWPGNALGFPQKSKLKWLGRGKSGSRGRLALGDTGEIPCGPQANGAVQFTEACEWHELNQRPPPACSPRMIGGWWFTSAPESPTHGLNHQPRQGVGDGVGFSLWAGSLAELPHCLH